MVKIKRIWNIVENVFHDFATAGLNVEILGTFIGPLKNYQVSVLELQICALTYTFSKSGVTDDAYHISL